VPCAEALRVQAYFDSEVDSVAAAEIERHIEHCAECRASLEDLREMRTALRRDLTYHRASPELRGRVMSALDRESPLRKIRLQAGGAPNWRSRPFWAGAIGGFGGAAIAASVAFLLWTPPRTSALLDDLVGAHIRSLMPAHLIDVESTDRHTVKPWFAGHADVSPVVADFTPQGYRLVGGRADYFDHQRAAAVVYQHGAHVINVFSWASGQGPLPGDATRNGYHLACWQAGNLDYCAVSDTGWDELKELVRLLRDTSAGDGREQR
jgi:anti-sigma factor RsiW